MSEVLTKVLMSPAVCGLLQLLACALDSLLQVLDCADDVFALGSTSNVVAAELASLSWAKTRRKVWISVCSRLSSASLDLCPCCVEIIIALPDCCLRAVSLFHLLGIESVIETLRTYMGDVFYVFLAMFVCFLHLLVW